MRFLFSFLFLSSFLLMQSCLKTGEPYSGLAPGPWRVVLHLTPQAVLTNPKGEPLPELLELSFEEVTEGELPFLMEVVYLSPDSFVIDLVNGMERTRLNHIKLGLDRKTAKDTLVIEFPIYDSRIEAIFEEKIMQGEWIVNYKENYRIPLTGRQGKNYRFTSLKKDPVANISGRWEVRFGTDTDQPYPAVGQFQQTGNHLYGTFATETGDFRFLEGTVQGDKLYLSTFDGSHAFLFEGKILPDSTLIGSFRSGSHYQTTWEGKRNEQFSLRAPDSLSKAVRRRFDSSKSFPSLDGGTLSLGDPPFTGKPKVLLLMGTWCPNCKDASAFLDAFLAENPDLDLAVAGIAFEKYRDTEKALEKLATYRKNRKISFPLVLGGYADKQEAAEALGVLDQVTAYPTFILLNDQNEVVWVYSGFYGPATEEYQQFRQLFKKNVMQLFGI